MPLLYEKESYEIRGACFAIWKKFGGAYKETIIDKSLTIELKKRNLKVEDQKRINVYYDGKRVGAYVPDKVINDKILVEVKSKEFITKQDEKQFWDYLKASNYKLGFLINFGTNKLEIKRIVYDTARYMRKTK
ncbi:MAG: GxxExxY protein [Patescibacteria group bacterium]